MQFRRLKLSGFKSFVEPAELRIEPGLTGVVGPNGCGKSNLLEAIRWVMGEGSAKSLRGGGMDDVIFAGTATRPARNFAEVALLLDTPAGDREVARRIERGMGSAYRLDGRDVRARDVALLFADAATGAHSPAMVGQNRIGAVIAARPTERRQMLEEAAGISGLHVRRKDAEQKLRATEVNLAKLDELLADQEQRIGQLRRQARTAERYRAVSARIRQAEGRLIYARWAEADRAAGLADGEARGAADEVAALGDAMTRAQIAQQHGAAEVAVRRGATQEARDEVRNLAHALATARARRDTVVRRLAELARLAATLSAETAREQALSADADAAVASVEVERAAIEAKLADGDNIAARIAAELDLVEAASRDADAALAGLLARDAAMRAERRVAEVALEAATDQLARTHGDLGRLEGQQAALGDGTDLARSIDQAEAERASAAAALAAAEAALAVAEAGRTTAVDQRDAAETTLAGARAVVAAAAAERTALRCAIDQARPGAALATITADPGFERVLAGALGDDLDAAIGKDGARRWEGSVGTHDAPLATGLVPLLAHVRAPPEIHRRLAQVGVAERDDGQLLAPGQRLVTRDGVVRRWDGFVARGGGGAAAAQLIRANRLAALDDDHAALEAAVEAASSDLAAIAARLDEHRREADHARAAITAAERDRRDAERAGSSAAAAVERRDGQRAAIGERIRDLEAVLRAAQDAVAGAERALAALPDAAALAIQIEAARATAFTAGQAVADKRAQSASRARETGAARERLAAAAVEAGEWRRRAAMARERLAGTDDRERALDTERDELAGLPKRLAADIEALEVRSASGDTGVQQAALAEREAEAALASVAHALGNAGEALADARERRAGAVARAEHHELRRREFGAICGEKFECPPPLLPERMGFAIADLARPEEESASLERMTAERERLGPVNLVAESELATIEASLLSGAAERDELHEAIHRLRGSIGSLNREGRARLLDAFALVDRHFSSLFATLFDGGQAHLDLVESDDPLEAGLEIMAQPPGKRLSTLTLLSGGEQALTAVALIFALFLTNPAPICVLDEVDAPLDDANIERYCDLLDRMAGETDTRYLIVTHNAVTMSRMHRLYGVTMIEKGVSRLVSVDLQGAEGLLAAE